MYKDIYSYAGWFKISFANVRTVSKLYLHTICLQWEFNSSNKSSALYRNSGECDELGALETVTRAVEELRYTHSSRDRYTLVDLTWHDLTWPDLTGLDRTWPDLTGWPDFTWLHLTSPDFTWLHLNWPELTWSKSFLGVRVPNITVEVVRMTLTLKENSPYSLI